MNKPSDTISAAEIAAFAASATGWIAGAGQRLLVTRPATTQNGAVSTRYVYFTAEPLSYQSADALLLEAGLPAGEGDPHDFVCKGTGDVGENDLITYDGFKRRVFKVNAIPIGTTKIDKHCYTVRESKA